MISMYFGMPGAGKTTLMVKHALDYVKRGITVYCNVHITVPGVIYIENDWIGKYDIRDGVVLIDEGAIFASARRYKSMSKTLADWLNRHRHYSCDVIVYTQRYNGVDVNIRELVQRLYYVRKHWLFRGWSIVTPVRYTLIIPKDGDKAGEIVEGYQLHGLLMRMLLTRWVRRKPYYPYFDSWEAPPLPPLPTSVPAAESSADAAEPAADAPAATE